MKGLCMQCSRDCLWLGCSQWSIQTCQIVHPSDTPHHRPPGCLHHQPVVALPGTHSYWCEIRQRVMAFDTGWTVSNESGLDPLGGWPICRSGRQCVGGLWAKGEGGCVHRCLDCALTAPIYATCTNRWGTCALSTSCTGTRYIYGHVHIEWMQFVQLTYTFNTSENVRVARNWHGKSSETTLTKDLTDGICQFIGHLDPD